MASSVDLVHEDTSPLDRRKQALADQLAEQLQIDMTEFWKADLAFWVRLPKAALMAALAEAPGMQDKSEQTRSEIVKAHAKLRKDDLAARVSAMFEGSRYLPDLLVTPVSAGSMMITQKGLAAITSPAIAAE